jgi:type IV pilus assembly protein PilQ
MRASAFEERAEKVTEYIPVNYGSAEDIAKLLTDESKGNSRRCEWRQGREAARTQQDRGFLSQRGSLSYDKRTNTLLVIDIPQRVSPISVNLVQQLDKPVDQVVIEAQAS